MRILMILCLGVMISACSNSGGFSVGVDTPGTIKDRQMGDEKPRDSGELNCEPSKVKDGDC